MFVGDRQVPGSNMIHEIGNLLNSYWDIIKYLQFMSLDDKIISFTNYATENNPVM